MMLWSFHSALTLGCNSNDLRAGVVLFAWGREGWKHPEGPRGAGHLLVQNSILKNSFPSGCSLGSSFQYNERTGRMAMTCSRAGRCGPKLSAFRIVSHSLYLVIPPLLWPDHRNMRIFQNERPFVCAFAVFYSLWVLRSVHNAGVWSGTSYSDKKKCGLYLAGGTVQPAESRAEGPGSPKTHVGKRFTLGGNFINPRASSLGLFGRCWVKE